MLVDDIPDEEPSTVGPQGDPSIAGPSQPEEHVEVVE